MPLSLAARVLERYARSTRDSVVHVFSVGEVQVQVEDPSVDEDAMESYARLMGRARSLLKSKGFGRAWYGKIHIQCSACGGVNPNEPSGGTGGFYRGEADEIWIFTRPKPYLIELLVHEIGHRVWWRMIKSDQRKRFTTLVKTHTVPRPPPLEDVAPVKFFTHADLAAAQRSVATELRAALTMLEAPGLEDQLYALTDAARDVAYNGLYEDLGETIDHLVMLLMKERDKAIELAAAVPRDLDALRKQIEIVGQGGEAYVNDAIREHNRRAKFKAQQRKQLEDANKRWQDSYDNNPNPVLPVSSYGKKKIEEAFAEVFQMYVLGTADLSRDQIESFRSVLASVVEMGDADQDHRSNQRLQLGQVPARPIRP